MTPSWPTCGLKLLVGACSAPAAADARDPKRPCRSGRCTNHGGQSPGPRTAEGRLRIEGAKRLAQLMARYPGLADALRAAMARSLAASAVRNLDPAREARADADTTAAVSVAELAAAGRALDADLRNVAVSGRTVRKKPAAGAGAGGRGGT